MGSAVDIPFGPTGKLVYERTYRRDMPDGTLETWPDTIERVVDGNLGLVEPRYIEDTERAELIDLFTSMRAIPAGRHLWMSGVPGRQFLFNCHVSGWTDNLADHFAFTFSQLMQGGGVGANYSSTYTAHYRLTQLVACHIVCDPSHPDYEAMCESGLLSEDYAPDWTGALDVEDSREGWVEALRDLIDAAQGKTRHSARVYDVSRVRASGSRIKSFGGTAAGPAPLAVMLRDIAIAMNRATALTPIVAMDIDHAIAQCVVSGNVRRSARMSIVHWADPYVFDFIHSKADPTRNWSTNISVEIDEAFIECLRVGNAHAKAVYEAVVRGMLTNGEPGLWNSDLSNVGEPNPVVSTNPCGEIALAEWENCFSGDEKIITREGIATLRSLVGKDVHVWHGDRWHDAIASSFGVQPTQLVTFVPVRSSGHANWQRTPSTYELSSVCTPNHRWDTVNRGVVSDLQVGDIIASNPVTDFDPTDYGNGLRHGIMFGDGCRDRTYANGEGRYRARLFGRKARYRTLFDNVTYPASLDGAPEVWLSSSTDMKDFPPPRCTLAYNAGFMDGWVAMDASVRPNGNMHLGTTRPGALAWVQDHGASAGWTVRAVTRDERATNYGPRTYPLNLITLARKGSWRVESIQPQGEQEVFCVTVPSAERFTLSNGLTTMNCNLGHINLDAFANDDICSLYRAHELMARFLIRATFGDVTEPRQAEVLAMNRRIGVGHFGFQGFLVKNGIRYSKSWDESLVRDVLNTARDTVRQAAREYAFQLRIPEPVKVTTVAPTGTIAKIPGRTEGIHPIYARHFLRRVRFSTVDDAQIAQVADLATQGYEVEADSYSANTAVVSIPTKEVLVREVEDLGLDPELVESVDEISLEDMLAVQAMYQECYADNAVSFTVNIPAEEHQERAMLHPGTPVPGPSPERLAAVSAALRPYLRRLKGTTLMVDGSRPQAPYERITREQFESATFGLGVVEDGTDEDCASGACPVR